MDEVITEDTSLRFGRTIFFSLFGLITWFIIGVLVRLFFLMTDHFDIEGTLIGLLIREAAAGFFGAFFTIRIFQKSLNFRSRELFIILFSVITGTIIFGGLAFWALYPGIPFSVTEGLWYSAFGLGTLVGVWHARIEDSHEA